MDEFHFADGVMVKMICFRRGERAAGHKHTYDHTTFICPGSVVRATCDGEEMGTYTGPTGLTIKAGCFHEFESITESSVMLCIHNTHGIPAAELEGRLVSEKNPTVSHA